MAAEQSPAYQWYVKDWRSSRATQRMSFAERGVYREMLDQQWEDLTLPDDAQAVADLIATTEGQTADVLAAWPVVRRNFTEVEEMPGRIVNARLEVVRKALKRFVKGAKKGGKTRASQASRDERGAFQPTSSPTSSRQPAAIQAASSTAISTATAISTSIATADPGSRSKRPIFSGQRLTVFEWMLDDCCKTLGPLTDAFDLHEWFFSLDAQASRTGMVIPQRDGGAWLQAQLVAEAQRRGLPIASSAPVLGKQTTRLAAALANIKAEAS